MAVDGEPTRETSVRSFLSPGETMLWSGRPRTGVVLRPVEALLIPFSLMWGGFALFWEGSVLAKNGPLLFKLWGIPFVLVGLYVIAGRFVADALRRGRTVYGLTDRRVIVADGWPTSAVRSFDLDTLPDLTLTERPDGGGTVRLNADAVPALGRRGHGVWTPNSATLDLASDARHVHDLIRAARHTARGPLPADRGAVRPRDGDAR